MPFASASNTPTRLILLKYCKDQVMDVTIFNMEHNFIRPNVIYYFRFQFTKGFLLWNFPDEMWRTVEDMKQMTECVSVNLLGPILFQFNNL